MQLSTYYPRLRRSVRVLVLATMAVAAVATASAEAAVRSEARATPGTPPAALPKAFGTASVDGVMGAGEWSGAASREVGLARPASQGGGVLPAKLYVMNDANNIYIGLNVPRATVAASTVAYWFSDVSSSAVDVILLNPDVGFFDEYGGRLDTELGGTNDGTGRAIATGDTAFYEVSHPLDTGDDAHDISVRPGDTLPFSLFFRYIDPCNEWPRCFGDTTVNGLRLFVLREAVTLAPPEFAVTWTRSVASGRLSLLGHARETAELSLTISGPATIKATFPVTTGDFEREVVVPGDFLPGTYTISVIATTNGRQNPAGDFQAVVEGPVEGIVARTWMSARRNGREIVHVKRGTRQLWAHFAFAYAARDSVTVTWYDPRGRRVADTVSPNSAEVAGVYRSKLALRRGVWRCTVSVAGRVAGEARITVK